MHLAMKERNLKKWRKYRGTGVDNRTISALCRNKQTMQQCYDFAGGHAGIITRIKQALNSTGSMVGMAWVTVSWGVMVCSHSWPCRWRWFLPLRHLRRLKCTPSHPKLTYSMVQSPSWEANWFAASQEIPRILWNPKVHYCIHKLPPPVPILG